MDIPSVAVAYGVERWFVDIFLSLPGLCGFSPPLVPLGVVGMETSPDLEMNLVNTLNLCLQRRE